MSARAVRVLGEVDLILCEDTRVTSKLLAAYEIQKPLESFHQHSTPAKVEAVLRKIEEGKNIAFVSDAGTPGISDPGGVLVEAVWKRFGNDVKIVPIPGASAAIAALSVSGFPTDQFRFLGFPPHKKGRKTFFESLADMPEAIVFFESKYRIEKALTDITASCGDRKMMVARELTKQFETLYRGTAQECLDALTKDKVLGEFVAVLAPLSRRN